MTSIPFRRAAYARVPSGDTANAAGTPCSGVPPITARVLRSSTETARPVASTAREPSGVAATAWTAAITGMGAAAFVRVSMSCTWAVPVATTTTRPWATGAMTSSSNEAIRIRTTG